jgi:hypothetical protein
MVWCDSQSRHGSAWLRRSRLSHATLIGATARTTYLHSIVTTGLVMPRELARLGCAMKPVRTGPPGLVAPIVLVQLPFYSRISLSYSHFAIFY